MATVSNPQPPTIHPNIPGKSEEEWASEELTHLHQERLAHEGPNWGATIQTVAIAVVIVGSVLGAAIWYLLTH
jgi:hypothetical protein